MFTSLGLRSGVNEPTDRHHIVVSTLTLLVGCQEEKSIQSVAAYGVVMHPDSFFDFGII